MSSPNRPFLHVEADRLSPHLPTTWTPVTPSRLAALRSAIRASCIAFAEAGFDLIVDGILPYGNAAQIDEALAGFRKFRLCYVGVHCDLHVLEEREKARPDRKPGWARRQAADLHAGQRYDVEVDTTSRSADECARRIAEFLAAEDPHLRPGTGT